MMCKDRVPGIDRNLHDWTANYPAPLGAIATSVCWPKPQGDGWFHRGRRKVAGRVHDAQDVRSEHLPAHALSDGAARLRRTDGEEAGSRQPEPVLASGGDGGLSDALGQGCSFPLSRRHARPAGQTMQAREYIALHIVVNDEVGNQSNIASAVFQAQSFLTR